MLPLSSSCIRCAAIRRLIKVPIKYNIPLNLSVTFSSQSDKGVKEGNKHTDEEISSSTAWIPPPRPLSGDKGNYYDKDDDTNNLSSSGKPNVKFYDLSNVDEDTYEQPSEGEEATNLNDMIITSEEIEDAELTDEEVRKLIEQYENTENEGWEDDSGLKEGVEYAVDDDGVGINGDELDEEKLNFLASKIGEDIDVDVDDDDDDEPVEMEIPDWMVTRRKKIAKDVEQVKLPAVIHHTLLSSKEIMSCLNSLGKYVILRVINFDYFQKYIFCGITSNTHVWSMLLYRGKRYIVNSTNSTVTCRWNDNHNRYNYCS